MNDLPDILTVNLTDEHIAYGIAKDCLLCPIALAIKEANYLAYVIVDDHYAVVDNISYRLPAEARDFVTRFDEGQPVSPFSFTAERVRWTYDTAD